MIERQTNRGPVILILAGIALLIVTGGLLLVLTMGGESPSHSESTPPVTLRTPVSALPSETPEPPTDTPAPPPPPTNTEPQTATPEPPTRRPTRDVQSPDSSPTPPGDSTSVAVLPSVSPVILASFTPRRSVTPRPTIDATAESSSRELATLNAQATMLMQTLVTSVTPVPETRVAVVATVPVIVRGIGYGEARVYAPTQITANTAALIRLEIFVTTLYASTGSDEFLPPPLPIDVTLPPTPTALPLAAAPKSLSIYPVMGAALRGLPPERFSIMADPEGGLRPINPRIPNRWEWTVRPLKLTESGSQRIVIQVYVPQTNPAGGEPLRVELIEPFEFQLNIDPVASTQPGTLSGPVLLLIGALGLASVIAIAVGTVAIVRRTNRRTAFISYRRRTSSAVVQIIAEKLRNYGVDAFFDTREISGAGRFPDRLLRAIEDNLVFIALLGEGTLESEWCLKEIQHAALHSKVMIPIFQESYKPPTGPQPDYVQTLLNFDGLPILDVRNVYIDETVESLAQMIRKAKRR